MISPLELLVIPLLCVLHLWRPYAPLSTPPHTAPFPPKPHPPSQAEQAPLSPCSSSHPPPSVPPALQHLPLSPFLPQASLSLHPLLRL